jgi:hypothetical protein
MANEIMKQESAPVLSNQREHDQFEFDYRLSKALSASNMTGIFKTPEQVFTAIQYGRGHGWNPMQSLRNLYPLHGNVHLTAIAAMGLVLPHADKPPTIKRENKNGQPYSCTVTYLRDKEEYSRTFTIDQAKSAGLIKGGGAWTAYAENMLFWRAGMFVAREAFPDILAGIYSIEEITNESAEDYQTKVINPDKKQEGTGLLDQLKGDDGNWPELRYDDKPISEPQDTQPDPDLIITEQADVVDPEPEKKPAKKAKSPSEKIKEMAEEKSLSDSRSDSVNESEIQPEMF